MYIFTTCSEKYIFTTGILLFGECYASKFGKLSSGHRTRKDQFSFQYQRKAMPKNVQSTTQLYSSLMLASTLAWKIPWMEEPGRLQSIVSLRVGHDWVTTLSCIGEGNGNALQCSCLENPRDGGAWWAALYRDTQSQTRLKWLSSSSSSTVLWTFFGIAFLWYWNENWHCPVLWPLLSFPNLLVYRVQHFHSITF